jgi:hypothetical protein
MTATAGHDLAHVYWMGGSPCSGKSSIADLLSKEHNLRVYHVDEAFQEQRRQITPQAQPTLYRFLNTPWNEIWMRPGDVLFAEAITAYGEHFEMILRDLRDLPRSSPVLVEGTALLPGCVHGLLADFRRAIWVVPTEAFQRDHYPKRGAWVGSILEQCTYPEQALRNWMDRDVAFARWVEQEAIRLGLCTLQVDGRRTVAQNARTIERHFALS